MNIKQIVVSPRSGNSEWDCLYALCEDGSVWKRLVYRGEDDSPKRKWYRITGIGEEIVPGVSPEALAVNVQPTQT